MTAATTDTKDAAEYRAPASSESFCVHCGGVDGDIYVTVFVLFSGSLVSWANSGFPMVPPTKDIRWLQGALVGPALMSWLVGTGGLDHLYSELRS